MHAGPTTDDRAYKEMKMRMILLWLLGVPISLIVLLKLFGVF